MSEFIGCRFENCRVKQTTTTYDGELINLPDVMRRAIENGERLEGWTTKEMLEQIRAESEVKNETDNH